jgi:GNAT superfamily N-acetyltransferase
MDNIVISKDKKDIDIEKLVEYICSESYWGKGRTREIIERSIDNSVCYSVLSGKEFAGFARVITDKATFNYICDLFIFTEYRGKGLGKKLIDFIVNDPEIKDGGHLLLTRDAHELYGRFGFKYSRDNDELINKLMYKQDPRKKND